MTVTETRFEAVGGVASRPLFVNRRRYDVPPTSRAVFPSGEPVAYLLDAANRVFVLTGSGDVEAPDDLAAQIRAEFFPVSSG